MCEATGIQHGDSKQTDLLYGKASYCSYFISGFGVGNRSQVIYNYLYYMCIISNILSSTAYV